MTPLHTARPLRRLAGLGIDFLVIALLTSALWVRYGMALAAHELPAPLATFLVELAATALLAVGYSWVLIATWGTTVGKRSVGTWVASAGDGSRVGWGRALLRVRTSVVTRRPSTAPPP